jgi:uncharacterized protein (TIGR02588 family)
MTKRSPTKQSEKAATRSGPEWIILGVSASILAAVVLVLVVLAFRTDDPASPAADPPGPSRQVGEQFFVPVDIVNNGDVGAAEVQVLAELTIDGVTSSGDQVVDFLGGGERQQLIFIFDDDPADGELEISVTGFAEP